MLTVFSICHCGTELGHDVTYTQGNADSIAVILGKVEEFGI